MSKKHTETGMSIFYLTAPTKLIKKIKKNVDTLNHAMHRKEKVRLRISDIIVKAIYFYYDTIHKLRQGKISEPAPDFLVSKKNRSKLSAKELLNICTIQKQQKEHKKHAEKNNKK